MKLAGRKQRHLIFDIGEFLSRGLAQKAAVSLQRGQMIFGHLDIADAIFYIQEGSARLAVNNNSGSEIEVGRVGKGDILGAECLAGQLTRTATAVALSDCSLIRIEKEAALRVMHEDAGFAKALLTSTLIRFSQIETARINQLRHLEKY